MRALNLGSKLFILSLFHGDIEMKFVGVMVLLPWALSARAGDPKLLTSQSVIVRGTPEA